MESCGYLLTIEISQRYEQDLVDGWKSVLRKGLDLLEIIEGKFVWWWRQKNSSGTHQVQQQLFSLYTLITAVFASDLFNALAKLSYLKRKFEKGIKCDLF